MEQQQIIFLTAEKTSNSVNQISSVLSLSEEGCTIPFISRYRKEKTGNLDELAITKILKTYESISNLEKRRDYINKYLEEQNKLTPELKQKILDAESLTELEDLYLPFKPRKKTKADKAIEAGLLPLAEFIIATNSKDKVLTKANEFINETILDSDSALQGAIDILTQKISDKPEARKLIRTTLQKGNLNSSIKRGKKEEGDKFKDYFDFNETIKKIPAHRIMAVLRGEQDGILNISITPELEETTIYHHLSMLTFNKTNEFLLSSANESYKRHLLPSLTKEVIKLHKEKAELESVNIFAKNLEKILLSAPFGEKAVIGIEPGVRTGCKVAVIDKNGAYKNFKTIYLHKNPEEINNLENWFKEYNIKGIAIGDGTFGRETYSICK